MTVKEAVDKIHDELFQLSFLAAKNKITPDEFDKILPCYLYFNYAMEEVNEV